MNLNDPMTDKEMQIRVNILPQLERLANLLWDNERGIEGRKLDKITEELITILNQD